jgi:hypothetical protein
MYLSEDFRLKVGLAEMLKGGPAQILRWRSHKFCPDAP